LYEEICRSKERNSGYHQIQTLQKVVRDTGFEHVSDYVQIADY